jgi:quercetin dioxygenase-like cupin family protein
MIKDLCYKQLLPVFIFLIGACTNQQQADETKTADTIAREEPAATTNIPQYDTSRSVTTVSPRLYKKLTDTLGIRLLEATYKPGDSSITHAHPDFMLYVLEPGTAELTATDGTKQKIEFKKGMGLVLPATTHSAKNIGKTTLKVLVVEVNRPRP